MTVTAILPSTVDDPSLVSGGNRYGQEVCRHLPARPCTAPVAQALASLPDGATALLDGLVACRSPEAVVPHAARLALAVVVHLPLACETGLDPAVAADLDARERVTLRAVSAVIATSDRSARELVARHRLDPARVHTVEPGTDPAPPAAGTDGCSRLLCVAALTPHKRQHLLVRALATVADRQWTCALTGSVSRDPVYAQRIRDLIVHYGLSGRVSITGPLVGDALDAAYHQADLVVLASHSETYGMVLAEALVRGIPVLTTAGELAPRVDAADLGPALRHWLTDPVLREEMRAHARGVRLPTWADAAHRLSLVLKGIAL